MGVGSLEPEKLCPFGDDSGASGDGDGDGNAVVDGDGDGDGDDGGIDDGDSMIE